MATTKRTEDPGYEVFKRFLSATIRSKMVEKKFSADALAELTGMAPSAIRMLRTGKSGGTMYTLGRIFNVLDVSMDEFWKTVTKLCEKQGIKWHI